MIRLFYAACEDRDCKDAAYALLEKTYFLLYGKSMPAIQRTKVGKPYFADCSETHFSLSHSKTHVMCAFSKDLIGVDIESPRKLSDRAIMYFSTERERMIFEPLDLWVLKESYVKMLGGTVTMVRNIEITMEKGKIIAPITDVNMALYHFEDCAAALSSKCFEPPDIAEKILLT